MQHLNYYTLLALTRWLQTHWTQAQWIISFSQQKDELVILLKKERQKIYLRVSFDNNFSYIAPFRTFRRARANTIDLFKAIEQNLIISWHLIPGERLIQAHLTNNYIVLFKLHGSRGNILLYQNAKLLNQFRHDLADEHFSLPVAQTQHIDLSTWSPSVPLNKFLKSIYPAFDSLFHHKIERAIQQGFSLNQAIEQTLSLATAEQFIIAEEHDHLLFLLWPPDNPNIEIIQIYRNIDQALESYVQLTWSKTYFEKTISDYQKRLTQALQKAHQRLNSLQKSLQSLQNTRSEEELGHLILANLHSIPPKAQSVTVFDYYTNQSITIMLDPQLNAQQNAELFYKKHKDNRKKYEELSELVPITKQTITQLQTAIDALTTIQTRQELKQFEKTYAQVLNQNLLQEKPSLPYRVFNYEGYEIRVGKNAKANDELTFKHSRKDDIWMHTREGRGAHVLIRRKSGQTMPPPNVLEYAAGLAGYFSSQRGTTLAAIAYTFRKYVRKLKTSGRVIYTQDKTILTEPINPN